MNGNRSVSVFEQERFAFVLALFFSTHTPFPCRLSETMKSQKQVTVVAGSLKRNDLPNQLLTACDVTRSLRSIDNGTLRILSTQGSRTIRPICPEFVKLYATGGNCVRYS